MDLHYRSMTSLSINIQQNGGRAALSLIQVIQQLDDLISRPATGRVTDLISRPATGRVTVSAYV